jgi:hypothetical protein
VLAAPTSTKQADNMKFLIYFALSLISLSAFGQQTEIDAFCQKIDSTINGATNIGQFLVRHPSDYDTTRLFERYFIDTVNLVLLKSVYDANYYAKEYIEFYYRDTQLVRINARHELDDKKYAGVFYYQQGNFIPLLDGPTVTGSYAFDISELVRTGTLYLRNSSGIFDLIKRNRHSEANRRR